MVSPAAARLLLDPSSTAHDVVNVKFLRRFRPDQWPERLVPPPPTSDQEYLVSSILSHRGSKKYPAKLLFQTTWLGYDDRTWEPPSSFFSNATWSSHFLNYHKRRRRSLPSLDLLAQAAITASPPSVPTGARQ
jgi:hypothetical protein